MRLPISDITAYLAPFPSYGRLYQIFAIDMGVSHFNDPGGGDPLQISG